VPDPQKANGSLERVLKLIGWGVSMIVLVIAAVLYLEHRHQNLIETLAEMRADMRHLDSALASVKDANAEDHAKIYKALEALNENDQQLALEVTSMQFCCETKPKKFSVKPTVYLPMKGESSKPSILPWSVTVPKGGQEIVLSKNVEVH